VSGEIGVNPLISLTTLRIMKARNSFSHDGVLSDLMLDDIGQFP
jgi:hypothetical protein